MMLALFSKKQKKTRESIEISDDAANKNTAQTIIEPVQDEDAMKKTIADKLRKYRPVERDANFTGPKYYR